MKSDTGDALPSFPIPFDVLVVAVYGSVSYAFVAQSIRNHDQGKKHVEIVAEFFRKKREDKLKGAQSETDLKRQIDRIEKVWDFLRYPHNFMP